MTVIDDLNAADQGGEPTTSDVSPDVSSDATPRGALWAAGVIGKAWALRPDILTVMQHAIAAGEQPPLVPQGEEDEPAAGIIPLHGLITPHGSFLSLLFGGGGGLDQFRRQLSDAVDDESVSHIVIDVDSPGGLVDLVPETAAEVRAARDVKPVVAVANTQAASAAYWIAAQAGELIVTPSGDVGSIGVFSMHRDISGAQEQMGVKTTLISAGRFKTEGNPYEPLSSEARRARQQDIDEIYGMFVADVATGRGVSEQQVRDGFGEGRTVMAGRAVDAGMADRVATLEQTVARLLAPVAPDQAVQAADHGRAVLALTT